MITIDGCTLHSLKHHKVIRARICNQNLGPKRNNFQIIPWIFRPICDRIWSWKIVDGKFVSRVFLSLVPPEKDAWVKSYDILKQDYRTKIRISNISDWILLDRLIATIEQYLPLGVHKVSYCGSCFTISHQDSAHLRTFHSLYPKFSYNPARFGIIYTYCT